MVDFPSRAGLGACGWMVLLGLVVGCEPATSPPKAEQGQAHAEAEAASGPVEQEAELEQKGEATPILATSEATATEVAPNVARPGEAPLREERAVDTDAALKTLGEVMAATDAPMVDSLGGLGVEGIGTGGGGIGYGGGGVERSRATRTGAPSPARPVSPQVSPLAGAEMVVNAWKETRQEALSTFAADVDTASYTLARTQINNGQRPEASLIRPEEFVNYFLYGYTPPAAEDSEPFTIDIAAAPSPFGGESHYLRLGVRGKSLAQVGRKPTNLTFLVDVSGSMNPANRLPLAKQALRILVDQLEEGDTVALVTYASNTRVVLPPTSLTERGKIHAAIEDLKAGGSTAMGSGIDLAYAQAKKGKKKGSVNRVIILSDGDANVGDRDPQKILSKIQQYVDEGITLSTVGFGIGRYRDDMMERLANQGNGNNYFIDNLSEAKRVFAQTLGGTLQVIAKDVKFQVEFDPTQVVSFRQIGYENRQIAHQDFRNDKVDAGEIGAGHRVTVLYEIKLASGATMADLATLRVRYKAPDGDVAKESTFPITRGHLAPSFDSAHGDFRFAVAVATFAELLRGSELRPDASIDQLIALASAAIEQSQERQDFVALMKTVQKKKWL